jgi:hypothetical protein
MLVQVKRVKNTQTPKIQIKPRTKNSTSIHLFLVILKNKTALYLTHKQVQFNIALSIIVFFYLFVLDYTCP